MPPASDAPARVEDVDELCGSMPHTRFGVSWGDVPTWLVPEEGKGRGFVLYRKPHRTAVDPATGEMYDDLIVVRTANADDKQALVEADGPFFTIDHFRGYNAVLLSLARIGEVTRAELAEVITDAWRAVAPKALVRELDA